MWQGPGWSGIAAWTSYARPAIEGRVTVGGRPFSQATADGDGSLTVQLPSPRVRATAVHIAANGFLPVQPGTWVTLLSGHMGDSLAALRGAA